MRLAFTLVLSMILLIGCSEEGSDKYDKGFIKPGDLYDRVDNNNDTLPNEYVFKSFTIPNKSYSFNDPSLGILPSPTPDCAAVIYLGGSNGNKIGGLQFGLSINDPSFTLKIHCKADDPLDPDATNTIVKTARLDYIASIKTPTSLGEAIVTGTDTDDLEITIEYIAPGCLPSESCTLEVPSGTATKKYRIYRVTFNRDLGFNFDSNPTTAEITINTGDTVYAQLHPLP